MDKPKIIIEKAPVGSKKKFTATIGNKHINFGAAGYSDYTIHKDPERKQRYIARHEKREDWTKNGYDTAGWLSRFILWNRPSLKASIADANKRFNLDIKFKK